jgi:mannose-6-phosphate isomerase-like protein (cupin superfamily)
MQIFDLSKCPEFIAGDSTILRQLIHPDKGDFNIRYSMAHARVEPGKSSLKHSLKSSEIYYILEGKGKMHINDETAIVATGQLIYIPPYATQYIENIGSTDLIFLCIVDPAWKTEDEVVE